MNVYLYIYLYTPNSQLGFLFFENLYWVIAHLIFYREIETLSSLCENIYSENLK